MRVALATCKERTFDGAEQKAPSSIGAPAPEHVEAGRHPRKKKPAGSECD
jgi:hypothetical protein